MSSTRVLAITELAPGQTQAFTTANDATAALEEAANAPKIIDAVANGTVAITELDMVRYRRFKISNHTAAIILTYSPTVNGLSTWRELVIENETAFEIVFRASATPGLTVTIPGLSSRIISIESFDAKATAQGGIITSIPYTLGVFAAGVPTNNVEILRYPFSEAVLFPDEFAGSQFSIGVNPTQPLTIEAFRGVTSVGTITISTAGAATFLTTGTTVAFATGQPLVLVFHAYQYGSINFTSVADAGDTVTINDGVNTAVVFTFGAGAGQVPVGASATASATNLKTAIDAATLDVTVTRVGALLTIKNDNPLGGGSITKSDADNDYTVVNFAADTTGGNLSITLVGVRT